MATVSALVSRLKLWKGIKSSSEFFPAAMRFVSVCVWVCIMSSSTSTYVGVCFCVPAWMLACVHLCLYLYVKENHANFSLKMKPNRMATLADIGITCENTHLPILKSPMVKAIASHQ